MQCSQVGENLYEYLTGRLSPTVMPVIAEHLLSCSACRAEHDEMKITLGLLDRIKLPQVSDGFTEKVMQSLEHDVLPLTQRPVYRYMMQAAAAAAVVLAVVSIIKLLPTSEKDSPTEKGAAATSVIAKDCRKAMEFYNKAAGTPDLKAKESMLKDALTTGCTDSKALARIHHDLADFYKQQNRLDEALAGYAKTAELDPELWMAYIGMGDMYKQRGQTQAAVEKYKQALALLERAAAGGEHVQPRIDELQKKIAQLK
jgi:tetratricopeptide (TPR) repeat protein